MKDFTDLPARPPQPLCNQEKESKQYYIKKSLAYSANRSPKVQEAIFTWLQSFQTGMSKKDFNLQLCRLEQEEETALKQLEQSVGRRTIKLPPRKKPPKITKDEILGRLGQYQLVAIEDRAGRKLIDEFLETLPEGGVYILDVNELILEYVDYQHRGKAGEIIEAANRASVLVIEGLEKSIALAYHIKDTLYQLAAVRKKDKDKYTLTTWIYTHQWYIAEYGDLFQHFSV